MPQTPDPAALKRLLSPLLLDLKGVSGLGLPGGKLTIYLASDDAAVRRSVEEIMEALAPGVEHQFEVTGPLRPL